jgi:hypothetical protein
MIAHRVSLAKLSRRAQSPSGDIFHVRACASSRSVLRGKFFATQRNPEKIRASFLLLKGYVEIVFFI